MVNSRQGLFTAPHQKWGPLLPKLRGELAKFLNEGSLARLSAFTPGHLCRFAVRAQHLQRLEAFLGTVSSEASVPKNLPCTTSPRLTDFPIRQPLVPNQHFQSLALPTLMRPSITPVCGAGILTCCPSATPFGLTLGPDFPWADDPSPGTLVLTAKEILTPFIVTHAGIRTSNRSTTPSGMASPLLERSPTRKEK